MSKLLIVDDSELNINMLSKWLNKKGFDVIVAKNGQEGIEKATRELPALILMDMTMPVLNGWDATRQLKSQHSTRSIPIIGLSAHALDEDRHSALDAGCDEYESKPLDLKRLTEKIIRFLPAT